VEPVVALQEKVHCPAWASLPGTHLCVVETEEPEVLLDELLHCRFVRGLIVEERLIGSHRVPGIGDALGRSLG
jgi:hypothetical protein